MSYMQTDGIKIDKHFPKNLGQYFMDGFGSDGTVVKGFFIPTRFVPHDKSGRSGTAFTVNEVVSFDLIFLMYLLDIYICSLGKNRAIINFDNELLIC